MSYYAGRRKPGYEPRERHCSECDHDISAYDLHALTCGARCSARRQNRVGLGRALASFTGARDRGAAIDPNFTAKRLKEMIDARGDCYLCGASLEQDFHIDHILPVSRGGVHEESNIGFLCPTCNVHKGDRTPEEYVKYVKDVDEPRIQRILARHRERDAA